MKHVWTSGYSPSRQTSPPRRNRNTTHSSHSNRTSTTHLGSHDMTTPEKAELEPDEDEDLYLIRDAQDNLLGYMQASKQPPGGPVPDNPVLREYTHQGDSLTINKLEVFEKYQGVGLGGEVLEQLKGQDYELIDLTARESAERFYLRHGFKDTELRDEGKKVLAWHNPEYKSREASLLEQQLS